MLYRVTKKYTRGSDILIAHFAELNDARIFIQGKLAEDERLKVKVAYFLFKSSELLEEHNADEGGGGTARNQPVSSQEGQQRGSSQTFRPTPFNVTPRPTGMPHGWVRDQDKKDGDDK